jgi:hypothetical protein
MRAIGVVPLGGRLVKSLSDKEFAPRVGGRSSDTVGYEKYLYLQQNNYIKGSEELKLLPLS